MNKTLLGLIWLEKNRELLFKISLCLVISIVFSSGHIENPDTHLRLVQSYNLVENGSIEIPEGVGDVSHGNIAFDDNDRAFSVYNPGQMVMFSPLVILAKLVPIKGIDNYYVAAFLVSFINYIVLGLLGSVLFNFGKILNISFKKNVITVLILVFTSYCFAHAQDSYEHLTEALFVLLTFYFAFKNRAKSSLNNLMFAALFTGLGLMFRTSTIFAVPGILFLLKNYRERVVYSFLLCPFLLFLLWYNYYRFGSVFNNGYEMAWSLAFEEARISSFNLKSLPKNTFAFFLSPVKGLFFLSPSILLAFWGWFKCWRDERRLFLAVIIVCLIYLGIYGSNFAWHGSAWCWGPRYILPIIPLIYLGVFFIKRSFSKKIVVTLLLISGCIQFTSTLVFYKRQLLQTYIKEGDVFWGDNYFMSFNYSPIYGQFKSLAEISNKKNKDLYFYLPNESWKNENRPASIELMLDNSVDFNSFNYWWLRIQSSGSEFVFLKLTMLIVIFSVIVFYFKILF